LPVGLISCKIVVRSLRLVTANKNTYQAANEHFKQMLILDKISYIWWLAATGKASNKISDNESASRKILEKTSTINTVAGEISCFNLTYLDNKNWLKW